MERTSSASYAASGGVGLLGLLTLNQWLAIAGFALAILTFAVNVWYRERHYRLEKRRVEATENRP